MCFTCISTSSAGYNMRDDEIEEAVNSGVTVFSKEVRLEFPSSVFLRFIIFCQ